VSASGWDSARGQSERVSASGWDSARGQSERVSASGWDNDEWDVALNDGTVYRIFRDRETDAWFIDGIVD
jgi:hypothetical protein